jgi:hypothetical protein
LKNIILEKYKSLLLERTISIYDDYWDNYIEEFYEEWLNDNGDALANFFEYPEYFFYWQESLNDWLELSEKNKDVFDKWLIRNNLEIEDFDNINELSDEDISQFQQDNLDFENFVEKTYLKKQFMSGRVQDIDYDEILYNLRELVTDNGTIRIFRAMKVPENYVSHLMNQGKHIGIYWSWDEDSVDTYWGDNKYNDRPTPITMTLYSEVKEEYVDWKTTLLMNCNINLNEEKEIRLYKGTPLRIKMIVDQNDNSIELPPEIKNKTFYA